MTTAARKGRRKMRESPRSYNSASAEDAPMISREPTIERLAVARSLLLEPFGLDECQALASAGDDLEHRVDYADLYFQYTRSEG